MMHFVNRVITVTRNIFSLDIRSLALFRVGISVILFWDLIMQFFNLSDFYTDAGLLPRVALQGNLAALDFHAISGSYSFQLLLLLIAGIFCFFLCVGYHTRIATVVSWLMQLSIQDRNPLIIHGGDTLLLMMLFWSIFLPLGATHSFDSIGKFFEKKSYRVFSAATIALLLQLFFLYFFAALLKVGTQWHQEGSAVYYALRYEQFATPFTTFLLTAPPYLLQLLTHIVWSTEAFIPFFFFFPFFREQVRILVVFILSAFHLGLGLFISLGTFVFIPIIALCALLPAYFWNQIHRLLQKYFPVSLTIYFDDDCGFCRRSVAIISYCLLLYGVRVIPAQGVPEIYTKMQHHNSWIVSDSKGKLFFKEQALARLLHSSPLFFIISPLFFWKPVMAIGDKVYEIIVKHRFIACSVPKPQKKIVAYATIVIKAITHSLVVLFLVCVALWNITSLPQTFTMSKPLANLCLFLHIDQYWNMFAPYPSIDDGWYIIPAKLKNGKVIDFFTNRPTTWKKPPLISSMYKDERWAKYMMNLWWRRNSVYRPYFASYLCNKWNKTHPIEEQAQNMSIYFMLKQVPPPFSPAATSARPYTLLNYKCG